MESPSLSPARLREAACITPSPRQLAWQRLEFYAFLHFGMNTFSGREWGDGATPPAAFNPTDFDPDQWVRAVKSAGMRGLILTCKHHDGFCLWPSALTDYSVRSAPWRQGRGDVVRAVADACRRGGLKFGVYLSPWDRHDPRYGSGKAYDDYYIGQLRELLTGYGEVFCVWMDGACGEGPNGRTQRYDWPAYYAAVRELQPGAVISICGPDVRWCGNEAGQGREAEWSVVPAVLRDPNRTAARSQQAEDAGFSRRVSSQDADLGSRAALAGAGPLAWYPAEVDTSIRPGWFYHPEEDGEVRDAETLFGIYLDSVGANASLLLNVPPTPAGLIAPPDLASLAALGKLLRGRFSGDIAPDARLTADSAAAGHTPDALRGADGWWQAAEGRCSATLQWEWPTPQTPRWLDLGEELTVGQRIESGAVLLDGVPAARFTVVGHRRICPLPGVPARSLTLCLAARAAPTLRRAAIYTGRAEV